VSTHPSLDEKIAFLSKRSSYADATAAVEVVETHFAWVFLTAQDAYKLKKPVQHVQMDYRTRAAREHGCREEVRLNRRLAPAVYQGVVPLSLRGRDLVIGAGDCVEDWLVKMRRLPSSRMLDQALKCGTVSDLDLERVVARLSGFFEHAVPDAVEGSDYILRLKTRIDVNRQTLRTYGTRLPQRLATEVASLQLEFVERAGAVLAARGARVVEGHGDLRAEHVYLGPPVAVIDCLEFDRDLRLLDPAEEIALLSLEIEQLGQGALAEEILRRFCAGSEHPPQGSLLDFYASHRAATSAKLAAWHLDDPQQFTHPDDWIAKTGSLLAAAASHATRALSRLRTEREEPRAHKRAP
jgi:uncharacterized protein